MYCKIIDHKELVKNIFSLTFEYSGEVIPGQFVMIRIDGKTLRRPISICDYNNNLITIVYEIRGEGTKILSSQKVDDNIDILEPLGNGFKIDDSNKTALIIGGGIGVPPLLYLGKKLKEKNIECNFVFGYRSIDNIILEKEFEKLGTIEYTTENGSKGNKGFVTHSLSFEKYKTDSNISIFACGPTPMLKSIKEFGFISDNIQISMEERMGCGYGACYGCSVEGVLHPKSSSTQRINYRCCIDGPVFQSSEVIL